jgi:hypothetical protein
MATFIVSSMLIFTPITTATAFKTWNVNLHRIVDLPAKPVINRTTIADTGKCAHNTQPNVGEIKIFGLAIRMC